MSDMDIASFKLTVLIAVLLLFVMRLIKWAKGGDGLDVFDFNKHHRERNTCTHTGQRFIWF